MPQHLAAGDGVLAKHEARAVLAVIDYGTKDSGATIFTPRPRSPPTTSKAD
jgi:hypothetical protein